MNQLTDIRNKPIQIGSIVLYSGSTRKFNLAVIKKIRFDENGNPYKVQVVWVRHSYDNPNQSVYKTGTIRLQEFIVLDESDLYHLKRDTMVVQWLMEVSVLYGEMTEEK